MNNDTGSAVAAHNLLLKRDHLCTEHLANKQKMASILASPQTTRKTEVHEVGLGKSRGQPPARGQPIPSLQGRRRHRSTRFSIGPGMGRDRRIRITTTHSHHSPNLDANWKHPPHSTQNRIRAFTRDRSARRPP
jgi:hypothetical protein